jgi:hypothetical protein
MIPTYESLNVIEKFFGEPLSEEVINRCEEMPKYQFKELYRQLDGFYRNWYHRRILGTASPAVDEPSLPAFMPVGSYGIEQPTWRAEFEHWLKCSLLYFPGRLEIPDPIGTYVPNYDLSNLFHRSPSDWELGLARDEILQGLPTLLTLKPLIDNGSISTIPKISVEILSNDSINMILNNINIENLPSYGPVDIRDRLIELEQMRDHAHSSHIDELDKFLMRPWDVTACWLWIGLCLDNSPVAADTDALATLDRDFRLNSSQVVQDRRTAQLISRFQIPGADNAKLADVVRMRMNEEAFYEFRNSFDRILHAVTEANPRTDLAFSREFQRHAYDELASQRAHVARDIKGSDFLRQMLSGLFLLGAAGVEAAVTHDAPVGTLLGGAAAGGGWLIPYLIRRSKDRKTSELTRAFYSSLIRRPQLHPVRSNIELRGLSWGYAAW